jgi:hypothetical protein
MDSRRRGQVERRPPAYTVYAKDVMTNGSFQILSLPAAGAYFKLMNWAWTNAPDQVSMPDDDAFIAKLLVIPVKEWRAYRAEMMQRPKHELLRVMKGKLVMPLMVESRRQFTSYRKAKSEAGKASRDAAQQKVNREPTEERKRPLKKSTEAQHAYACACANADASSSPDPKKTLEAIENPPAPPISFPVPPIEGEGNGGGGGAGQQPEVLAAFEACGINSPPEDVRSTGAILEVWRGANLKAKPVTPREYAAYIQALWGLLSWEQSGRVEHNEKPYHNLPGLLIERIRAHRSPLENKSFEEWKVKTHLNEQIGRFKVGSKAVWTDPEGHEVQCTIEDGQMIRFLDGPSRGAVTEIAKCVRQLRLLRESG